MNGAAGIERLGLYLPATGVERAAIAAAAGSARGKPGSRRVAAADEDTLTLAWEALDAATAGNDPVGPLFWAAGGVRDGAAREGALLGHTTGAEGGLVELGCGLRSGWDLLAGPARPTGGSVLFSDVRWARPPEPAATVWSDGAAALVLGNEPALRLVDGMNRERYLPDLRQAPGGGLVESEFTAFTMAAGVAAAVAAAAEWYDGDPAAAIWAVPAAVPGAVKRIKRTVPGDRLVTTDFASRGFAGVAEPAFLLAAAAAGAEPGDRIVLCVPGNGVSALVFEATDRVSELAAGPRWAEPQRHLGLGQWADARGRDGVAQTGPETSPVILDETAAWAIERKGGRCGACGTLSFPLAPRCHACGAGDLVPERIRPTGTAFTFTVDHLHPALEPPTTMIVAELDGGGRVYLQGTDDLKSEVAVDARVEMVLRRLHDGADGRTPHYFWKLRGAE